MNRLISSLLLAAVGVTAYWGGTVAAVAGPAAGIPSAVFREAFSTSLGNYWCEMNRLCVVDADSDGRQDILLMTTALASPDGPPWTYNSRVTLFRGAAGDGFTAVPVAEFAGAYGYNLVTGDLNGDGAPDFVVRAGGETHVYFNDGVGEYRKVGTAASGYYPGLLLDLNGDGLLDLVSGSQTGAGGVVMVSTNTGSGGFQAMWQSRLYGAGNDSIQTVLRVNLDGDGVPDLAAREIYGGRLITFLGTSNGAAPFLENRIIGLGERTFSLAAGRVNGDSLDDLAAQVGWGEVRVWVNGGGGQWSQAWTSPNLGQAAFGLALADFDRDGRDDVFVSTFGDGALRIYRNNGANAFDEWWSGSVPGQGYIGTVADMNGDGGPDLIVGEKGQLRVLLNRTGWPEIQGLARVPGGMEIRWASVPGRVYRVQWKRHLEEAEWTGLGGDLTATGVTMTAVDEAAPEFARTFYRVVQLP